ncbi:hypothetical protein FACS1894180_7970 [Bacteroidia bacterium]|nr:hypothetical protein FACS1894180_7970 [Bacteroidia bacterium]
MKEKTKILKWSHLLHSSENDVFIIYTADYADTFGVGLGYNNKVKFKTDAEMSFSQQLEDCFLFSLNFNDLINPPKNYELDEYDNENVE